MCCFTHHFPYRAEAATRARLDALCGKRGSSPPRVASRDAQEKGDSGHVTDMTRRYRTIENVYTQRWDQVDGLRRRGARFGVELQPWESLVEPADQSSARWYTPEQLGDVRGNRR